MNFTLGWADLTEDEQEDVAAMAELLMERGPELPFPYSSGVESSRHSRMRELRVQSSGRPLRVSMDSTPNDPRFCLSVATRRGTPGSTGVMCRLPTSCMTSTSKS